VAGTVDVDEGGELVGEVWDAMGAVVEELEGPMRPDEEGEVGAGADEEGAEFSRSAGAGDWGAAG
jgi:hypothetical protein